MLIDIKTQFRRFYSLFKFIIENQKKDPANSIRSPYSTLNMPSTPLSIPLDDSPEQTKILDKISELQLTVNSLKRENVEESNQKQLQATVCDCWA